MRHGQMNKPPIILYSATPWDAGWRPRHEFALDLGRRGWPVVYTNGALSTWDRATRHWKPAPWFGRWDRTAPVVGDRPGRLPCRWPGHALDKAVLSWHARRMEHISNGARSADRIAVAFDPMYYPYLERLNVRHVVYFQYEALSRLPGLSANFHELEAKLVNRADMIISLTSPMASMLPGTGPARARILPSAVRAELFMGAPSMPIPAALAAIPRPRIGYVGSITMALDFDLAHRVAVAKPDWHLVFVGPVETDNGGEAIRDSTQNERWQRLRRLPNVHWLPQQSQEMAACHMAHMDVNALWYRTSGEGWWLLGSPIKMYENLAVGRPVVGTRLDAVKAYAGAVSLADTPDEWVEALDRALYHDRPELREERLAVARANSWSKRTDQFEAWLTEMVSRCDEHSEGASSDLS